MPNLNPQLALTIFAAIIIIYTFLGGFKAVCWTDFFQGLLMLVALLAVPLLIVATKKLDFGVLQEVYKANIGGEEQTYAFVADFFSAGWKDIISGLAWGLGYFGMPHIIVRFMSIEKPSMVKKSATVAIVWVIISLAATICIAIFGRILIGEALLMAGQQEMVFVKLARDLFPPFIAGILLAAIIAASMSTADSQLLVASSSFTSDIYKPLFRKDASDEELLWVGRIVVLIVSVVAYFIAGSRGDGAGAIMAMVENAWGLFGAAFGPVVLLSLFWKRFTYKGAIAGIVVGAAVDILWLVLLSQTGIYEIIPGFILGGLAAIVVTLLDKKPSAEIEALYDLATGSAMEK